MIDAEEVKRQAAGRWRFIVQALAPQLNEMIARGPRRAGPCPLCGGRDRARIFGDFDETGGAYCNQCGPRLGDGFLVLKWANGWEFKTALQEVAAYLGLAERGEGAARRPPPPPPVKSSKGDQASIEKRNRERIARTQEAAKGGVIKGKI